MNIFSPNPAPARKRLAFTLIELLVVIAVIALLAGMIFPITGAINKIKVRSRAKAELQQIEVAIEAYKVKMGHYPPSDTNLVPNSLYYELVGSLFTNNVYATVDGIADPIPAASFPNIFGSKVGGVQNCTRGSGDEGQAASRFLKSLKPGQFIKVTNGAPSGLAYPVLGVGVQGPLFYENKLNPWRYNSTRPVYNKGGFDLFVDVKIGNDIYRVNNWSKDPFVVKPPFTYWPAP